MADLIMIKSGETLGKTPSNLSENELAYSTDEKALYIGTSNGNVKLCTADNITQLIQIIEELEEINARLTLLESN